MSVVRKDAAKSVIVFLFALFMMPEVICSLRAKEIFLKPQKMTVIEGQNVAIECKSIQSAQGMILFKRIMPEYSIVLFAGNNPTFKSDFSANNGTYSISKVHRKDSGVYSCTYQAYVGTIEMKYELDVQYPPSVKHIKPSNRTVQKDSTVRIFCEVDGNPRPKITWTRLNGQMLPKNLNSGEGNELVIKEADTHVEDTYLCTASNGIGESAYTTATLKVEYPPEEIDIDFEKASLKDMKSVLVDLTRYTVKVNKKMIEHLDRLNSRMDRLEGVFTDIKTKLDSIWYELITIKH